MEKQFDIKIEEQYNMAKKQLVTLLDMLKEKSEVMKTKAGKPHQRRIQGGISHLEGILDRYFDIKDIGHCNELQIVSKISDLY